MKILTEWQVVSKYCFSFLFYTQQQSTSPRIRINFGIHSLNYYLSVKMIHLLYRVRYLDADILLLKINHGEIV